MDHKGSCDANDDLDRNAMESNDDEDRDDEDRDEDDRHREEPHHSKLARALKGAVFLVIVVGIAFTAFVLVRAWRRNALLRRSNASSMPYSTAGAGPGSGISTIRTEEPETYYRQQEQASPPPPPATTVTQTPAQPSGTQV